MGLRHVSGVWVLFARHSKLVRSTPRLSGGSCITACHAEAPNVAWSSLSFTLFFCKARPPLCNKPLGSPVAIFCSKGTHFGGWLLYNVAPAIF